jgi:hypothetical protein
MAVGAVVARILTQYSDKGSKQAQKDIRQLGKNIDAFGKKATKAFAAVGVATAALAVKIGKDAVQAATEDSKSQAILASNLRNVTGATDDTIAAVEEYISKQQMLANVSDTELRASFSQLVTATGDVTSAITLQGVALDTAAGAGQDLGATSAALAKASKGNFTALKRLVPALDSNIVKNKDLNAAVAFLNKTYKGSAKIVGDTDPLKKLSLAYGEVLETLGYALLPVVIEFAEYIQTNVLPGLEEWIRLNEDELQSGLREVVELVKDFSKASLALGEFVIKYKEVLALIGTIVTGLVLAAKINAFIASLKFLGDTVKIIAASFGFLGTSSGKAATKVGLLAKAFMLIVNGVRTFLALPGFVKILVLLGTAAVAIYSKIKGSADDAAESLTKVSDPIKAQLDATREGYAEITKTAMAKAQQDKIDKARAADAAKRAVAANKQSAIDRRNIELRSRLEKKFGLRLTDKDEYENIQLTAVEMLQKKQKVADLALLERIKARKEEVLLFEALNGNAEKYTDLLKVLSDQKISSEEIAVLAKKWGMTTDAVTSYIFTIFAIKDTVVSSAEVKVLADSWGMTIKQAEQYLDFFNALNDGKLSEAEITKLMSKWMLTRTEATKYADFVSKIGDGKLDDSEITKLKSTWGLTTSQVVEYIKQIGGKVDATGTILSAGDIAALGWTNALTALQKYLNAQAKGTGGAVPTGTGPDLESLAANAARLDEVRQKLLAIQEKIKNKVKIPDDEPSSSNFTYGSGNPLLVDPNTGGLTGRGRNQFGGGGDNFAFMANGGIVTSPTQAIIGEAGAEAVIPLNRIGSILSSLTNSEGMVSGRSNNTNITVNVAGSVTSENDLVAAIRNGLLRGQSNGQTLTLQAI